MKTSTCFALAAAIGASALVSSAGAAVILDGNYTLRNHPDGAADPPPYGMRLDELVNHTAGNDIFTFDFDDAMSNMQMNVTGNGSVIHIFGVAWGGRDIGGAYAADAFLGLYSINFLYTVGVGPAGGDDDIIVSAPNASNFGTISGPAGNFSLYDIGGNPPPYNFRLGDEDNDAGHRGYVGISGWGWLGVTGLSEGPTRDWLFTATYNVPGPASLALLGAGLALTGARRRRD